MSKHRMLKPPQQGLTPRGTGKVMPMPMTQAGASEEISEIDALRARLAVEKDQSIGIQKRELEQARELLDQKIENLNLKIQIIRQENIKTIGHLNLQVGDNVYEDEGKWYIKRARPTPLSPRLPVAAPPAPVGEPNPPEPDKGPDAASPEAPQGDKAPSDDKT